MTKANLKEMYKNWNREITTACTNDDTLKRLQDLNEEKGSGARLCSWDMLLASIIRTADSATINKAFDIYKEHIENETRREELMKIATATNNFEI